MGGPGGTSDLYEGIRHVEGLSKKKRKAFYGNRKYKEWKLNLKEKRKVSASKEGTAGGAEEAS